MFIYFNFLISQQIIYTKETISLVFKNYTHTQICLVENCLWLGNIWNNPIDQWYIIGEIG